jgi:uncharacterized protein
MAKPVGPKCNLRCAYCFYRGKEALYPENGSDLTLWRMSDRVLEAYIRQTIEGQDSAEIQFVWQGGEPTLAGLDFFRKVLNLQNQYAQGKKVSNALQTNGILVDDSWAEFLSENRFLVGVSIDGPEEFHDAFRIDGAGMPTWNRVVRCIGILKRHGVEFNTLTVVHRLNTEHPLRVYRFLKEIGSVFIQFIPLVERVASQGRQSPVADLRSPGTGSEYTVTDRSVRPEDYGRFLISVFDEWVRIDVGRIFVQMFDVSLGIWAGLNPSLCLFEEKCGKALVLEHNGDLYSCDHFVLPEHRIGNILQSPIKELAVSSSQRRFGENKRNSLQNHCLRCEVLFMCRGECPNNRFIRTSDGHPGLNYLCEGYRVFFNHVRKPMETMTGLIQAGRAPAEIMDLLASEERERIQSFKAVGRNDPCPCGSGIKYKLCCLKKGKFTATPGA